MAGDQNSPTDRGHLATPLNKTPNPTNMINLRYAALGVGADTKLLDKPKPRQGSVAEPSIRAAAS